MSSISMLVTELQALSSETRRKQPDVSAASERALTLLRTSSASSTAPLSLDSQTLLSPILLGLQTRQAKPAALALAALQRAVLLKLVPSVHVPALLGALNDAAGGSAGVDIQLRVLQTLLNLLTSFKDVQGDTLSDGLRVAFRLHESRTPVVASTAAATLRQLVMHVLDKLSSSPRYDDTSPESQPTLLADGSTVLLGPAERDAHALVQDLCLLAHGEQASFLRIPSLPRTFALELVESVLTNYSPTFLSHPPLLLLLRAHLCPTLHRALAAEKPGFALTVRATRVVFLLLKQFSKQLEAEAEVFLVLLTRSVAGEDPEEHRGKLPTWLRVLALEVVRGLCADGELMRALYTRYDGSSGEQASDGEADGPRVVAPLVAALQRLVAEKPALLGVCGEMLGTGPEETGNGGGGGGVAGMVSGVVGMMGGEGGVGLSAEAGMRVQCIDQLDKADAPPIPEAYPYLLGTQALVALVDAQASYALPIYNQISLARPREPGEPASRAPPALDPTTLPLSEPTRPGLLATRGILQTTTSTLLPSLSYLLTTSLSDHLFGDVLSALSSLTSSSGSLYLPQLRDACLAALAHTGVPPRVRAALDESSYFSNQQQSQASATPRTASFSEALGMAVGLSPGGPPLKSDGVGSGLGERNLACLRALIGCTGRLEGTLGESWKGVLEALQDADGALERAVWGSQGSRRNSHVPGRSVSMSGGIGIQKTLAEGKDRDDKRPRHHMVDGADTENVRSAMDRLFESSISLSDAELSSFIRALCELSSSNVEALESELGDQGASSTSMLSLSVDEEDEGGENTPSASASVASLGLGVGTPTPRPRARAVGAGRGDEFALSRLGRVALLNVPRLVYRPSSVAWDPLTTHLLAVISSRAGKGVRVRAAGVLDEVLVTVARTAGAMKNEDDRRGVQGRVLDVLGEQIMGSSSSTGAGPTHESSADVEIRRMGLESLHAILQASAHTLLTGWDTIFAVLASVCRPPSESQGPGGPVMPGIKRSMSLASTSTFAETDDSAPPSPVVRPGPLGMKRPPPLGGSNERGYSALIKSAFQSLTLVCDALSVLSPDHLRLCISTLGAFGRQADTNIALTAAESLFWGVSDAIQAARRTPSSEPAYSALWMHLLLELAALCADSRPAVRGGAIQTLFRTLQLYGGTLSPETWSDVLEQVAFPLLGELDTHMAGAGVKERTAWAESKVVALQSLGGIVAEFLKDKLLKLPDFEGAWAKFVGAARDAFIHDASPVPAPALRCLEKALRAATAAVTDADEEGRKRIEGAAEEAWKAVDAMGAPLTDTSGSPLTQEALVALVALVDVISATRSISRALSSDKEEWSLPRITRALAILKAALTYTRSPDFRADIDALSPVQAVVLDAATAFEAQKVQGAPSVLLGDVAEYATLAFLGAFDAPPPMHIQAQNKATGLRVTYVALCKKSLPLLVQLFLRFKCDSRIWSDGTLERVLAALAIPIKLRYECPAAYKYARGEDERRPLWKRATEAFLAIVREIADGLKALEGQVEDERTEGVWRAVVDGFRGAILADCSPADSFPFAQQEQEAMFDLKLVAALESNVVPHLGDTRIPDSLVTHFARILAQGSKLRSDDGEDEVAILHPATSSSKATVSDARISEESESEEMSKGRAVAARERFAYWCFDLLFLICSDVQKDNEPARRRVAALALPALLDRARSTLNAFVADAQMRGALPFPRVREEELLYVLEKILALKLWPGSFTSSASAGQDGEGEAAPPNVIASAIQHSSRAHIFALYTPLVEIAAHQRTTPSGWTRTEHVLSSPSIVTPPATPTRSRTRVGRDSEDDGELVRRDARELARECLRAVGREMGVPA
ncbi:hypothetical protein PENSPDRAFT_689284 [Peniophora sp. CONT]|nr:hypothetical protein PENSPDRAFT_689284 [Peniophora sp. CONT]